MARKITFIRTTIAEPFPLFYGHVNQRCRRANDPATEGPFYAAGAEFFEIERPGTLEAKKKAAAFLAQDGYTVTVDRVLR